MACLLTPAFSARSDNLVPSPIPSKTFWWAGRTSEKPAAVMPTALACADRSAVCRSGPRSSTSPESCLSPADPNQRWPDRTPVHYFGRRFAGGWPAPRPVGPAATRCCGWRSPDQPGSVFIDPAQPLLRALALLLVEPRFHRTPGRLGGTPGFASNQCLLESSGQPLTGQLPVAPLRPGVGGDNGHRRPHLRDKPLADGFGEGATGEDLEGQLGSRVGPVGVLSAWSPARRESPVEFLGRDDVRSDGEDFLSLRSTRSRDG